MNTPAGLSVRVPGSPTRTERRSSKPWPMEKAPGRMLLIRFHAFGDVTITFPFAAALKARYPACDIDFLTSEPVRDLVAATGLFSGIFAVPLRRSPSERFSDALLLALRLRSHNYDVVIDLQRNPYSRIVRRIVSAPAWSEFDRFSPLNAGARVASACADAGFRSLSARCSLPLTERVRNSARTIMARGGWNGSGRTIVLNPAGLWPSRNWPLESYVALARTLAGNHRTEFLVLGTDRIRSKASFLKTTLGDSLVDLSGQTTPGEALALLELVSGIVTEDSGLMHMAWACGVPTVALFGSSYHIWSAPSGDHCRTLHSGDLPCGACMEPACRYGDTHCLTRWTPHQVAELLEGLLSEADRRNA